MRNSKVVDIIRRLQEYGIEPIVSDPWADGVETEKEYGIKLVRLEDVKDVDCVIVAVSHREFKNIDIDYLREMYSKHADNVLVDVKGIYDLRTIQKSGIRYWRL